jgi:signal transduction histidine kinase
MNLSINGIEAMAFNANGPRKLTIRSHLDKGNQIIVAVEDSGAGIAPENMEKVFDPFFTTKSDGMGMGLSICRSIIEAHGGRLWASGNLGAGMIFCFALTAEQGT